MAFNIIKDTPPMEIRRAKKGESKYPFAVMQVGDAFDLPLTGIKYANGADKALARLHSAVKNWKRRTGSGFKFQSGVVGDNTRCRRNA